MNSTSPTINNLVVRAGELSRKMRASAGLPPVSPMVFGMASGFDVAITLLEQSTGAYFRDLNSESASRVVKYFREEAARSALADPQVEIYYLCWAEILTATYLSDEP